MRFSLPFARKSRSIPIRRGAFAGLLVVLLAGCSGGLNFSILGKRSTLTPTPNPAATASPATGTAAVATATERAQSQALTIWVPPQFDPDSGSQAGNLLRSRLDAFASENPGAQINVRVKAASGPGGLLDALSAANAAAPAALPSLIALPRSELESAALKGLVFSLDELSQPMSQPDWFPYAKELALVQGSVFGLPFAGDAQVLLYRPARIPNPPQLWDDILARGEPLAFAAGDSQSYLTLGLYQSTGGPLQDGQGRPQLDAAALTQVLNLYQDGAKRGTFPAWLAQFQADSQAWQAYREQNSPWTVSWLSRYLSELPADTSLTAVPSLVETASATQATGWLWAVSERDSASQAQAARLAEYLVDSDFLAQWSEPSGYLPTRPSSLSAWKNQSLSALLNPIALSAKKVPSNELAASLGPVLMEATSLMIKGNTNAEQVAQDAAGKLGAP